jgi:hypothetical protein
MDDSIYSLGFVSQINDEIMESLFDIVKGNFRDLADAVVVVSPEIGFEREEIAEDTYAKEIQDKKIFNYQ